MRCAAYEAARARPSHGLNSVLVIGCRAQGFGHEQHKTKWLSKTADPAAAE